MSKGAPVAPSSLGRKKSETRNGRGGGDPVRFFCSPRRPTLLLLHVVPFGVAGLVSVAALCLLLFSFCAGRLGAPLPATVADWFVGGGGGRGGGAGGEGVGGGLLAPESLVDGWETCDLFDGRWVWDEAYPLYEERECGLLDGGFRCLENGRPDANYTKWRWLPNHCKLPRFDAHDMLQRLQNKRLVFVGDSIGRNQWESLLCMLSSVVTNKSSIYEVNGNPITKHRGFLVFKFGDYNCTVEYYRSPFLVFQSRRPKGVSRKVLTTLKLDIMDWTSPYWKDADILIFNSGHWWNYEKTIRSGCYFQEGANVKMEMSVEDAYNRAISTLTNWIHRNVNSSKTHVIYRTYSPVHFRGGDWKTGGNCHLETLPNLNASKPKPRPWILKVVDDAFTESRNSDIDLLNITQLTEERKDGHLSRYYLGPGKLSPLYRQDCSHWCLPGVPDAWNELLYTLLLRQNSPTSSAASSMQQSRQQKDTITDQKAL